MLTRLVLPLTLATCPSLLKGEESSLFQDLQIAEEINRKHADALPFFYNFSMMGGYYNMPSGRMANEGVIGIGGGRAHPYDLYGINFQFLNRVEVSANYRIFTGMTEGNFGHLGFGDDAERIANLKIAVNLPADGFEGFPTFVFGADDFIGTKRFNSQYALMTKQWLDWNLETTLGWGKHRIKGFFGGIAWTPFRKASTPFFNNLSILAEYDANNYKRHPHEHPKGRDVKSRINVGVNYVLKETLQLSVASLRGSHLGFSGSLRYPLGSSEGLFSKVQDPLLYRSPVDTEPLGVVRPKVEFGHDLAYRFQQQYLDVYQIYETPQNDLWIKIINNTYRQEKDVRERVERLLAALTPSNINQVFVSIEADGVICQSYRFRREDLYRYRERKIGSFEMSSLSPMVDPISRPRESHLLFKRTKDVWTLTFRPRLLTFFGSATGKFKYNVGLTATPEGYILDQVYYNAQIAYSIKSTMWSIRDVDRLNPSQLPNVRTDTIRYFQNNSIALERAFLQKSIVLHRGIYGRAALGYFEPAYGGIAFELLYFPVSSNWAVGLEEATVWKRTYHGLGFTTKVRKLNGYTPTFIHFIGEQFFLDLYYIWRPLDIDFKVMIGQFLAKDRGARFEITRWFPSGLNVSIWLTLTNGHDHVNGHTYHDKGFAFMLPLDFFLRKSSRQYIGYAMSAWLRDVGAIAENGRSLYETLRLERR